MTEKTKTTTSVPNKEKKKGGSIFLIIIVLLLLGANGAQLYFKYKDTKTIEGKNNTISEKEAEIEAHVASIDSLNNDIQVKIDSLESLGEDVTELKVIQADLHSQVKNLKRNNITLRRSKKKLEAQVRGYAQMLKLKDAKIESLSLTVTAQGDLIQEKNETIIRKDLDLEEHKKELADQSELIELAKVIKADKFQISSVKNSKAKIKSVYKAKDLATMQISFELLPNEVADVETKKVYVQIKEPSGNTIYDLSTGGGEFDFEGGSLFYTKELEVLYERSGKKVIFSFAASQPYKSGRNTIEVYTDGHLIGKTGFQIK